MTVHLPGSRTGSFVQEIRGIVGLSNLLVDPEITASHAIDWTGRFRADPVPVIRPGSTEEVAAVVASARRHEISLVPQGGNTGLVGGATPLDGGVVVDLRRISAITDLDPLGGQLTAGAGASIATVQAAAHSMGWFYGVDWAARDTATVGGSVATDAGGLRFVRHGSTRRQLLGIEAVLGSGALLRHLPAVEKDNTGYDLAALLCGSEGTLGLVTAVRLRLVAPPGPVATALVGFSSVAAAITAASMLRRSLASLEAVELMLPGGLQLVQETFDLPVPLTRPAAAVLLVEVSAAHDPDVQLAEAVGGLDGVADTAVALDGPRRHQLWRYREAHTEAIGRLGVAHKLDVTLPAVALSGFIEDVERRVSSVDPDARTWCFGHAADGNVHVNITGFSGSDERVDDVVLRAVAALGGSISGEHGIGRAKRRWLHLARSDAEIDAMKAIRGACDPDGICNPGVLLPP